MNPETEAAKEAIEGILTRLDLGERPTTGEMLLLRWYCGLPLYMPPNYRQVEMSVTTGE